MLITVGFITCAQGHTVEVQHEKEYIFDSRSELFYCCEECRVKHYERLEAAGTNTAQVA